MYTTFLTTAQLEWYIHACCYCVLIIYLYWYHYVITRYGGSYCHVFPLIIHIDHMVSVVIVQQTYAYWFYVFKGGFGVVCPGRHRVTGETVAIKSVSKTKMSEDKMLREAEVCDDRKKLALALYERII